MVHCGASGAKSLALATKKFALASDPELYREIDRGAAREILIRVLHRDLAYRSVLMTKRRAEELADRFLDAHGTGPCRMFTNLMSFSEVPRASSWNPVTAATFDLGVLILGANGSACLWVEDED